MITPHVTSFFPSFLWILAAWGHGHCELRLLRPWRDSIVHWSTERVLHFRLTSLVRAELQRRRFLWGKWNPGSLVCLVWAFGSLVPLMPSRGVARPAWHNLTVPTSLALLPQQDGVPASNWRLSGNEDVLFVLYRLTFENLILYSHEVRERAGS